MSILSALIGNVKRLIAHPWVRGAVLCGLLLIAIAAFGQDELDEDVAMYTGTWPLFKMIIQTIMWSVIYLPAYGIALVAPIQIMGRFQGYDQDALIGIAATWLGGLAINVLAYAITPKHWLAALIALPIIFGWTMLITTRPWFDLLPADALKVSLVVALVCAPYFGPTWHIRQQQAPTISRQPAPIVALHYMSVDRLH